MHLFAYRNSSKTSSQPYRCEGTPFSCDPIRRIIVSHDFFQTSTCNGKFFGLANQCKRCLQLSGAWTSRFLESSKEASQGSLAACAVR